MQTSPYSEDRDDATARALDWLMGRINYERNRVIPAAEQAFKLDAVRELLRRLGDPQDRLRIIHLAGTKGKGSTGAMIAASLEAAGITTGVYSSPHLDRLEERFAIGRKPCTAAELVALVGRVRPMAEAMDQESVASPTFFDLTTAMALDHFARREVGAVVLEVGLGGRLDSTNVVTPAVTVVTSISLDHTKQLGDTRAKIAAEKAGIFKPGVPAVSGVADAEAGDVISAIAEDLRSPFLRRGRDFDLTPSGDTLNFTRKRSDGTIETIDRVTPALPGAAQQDNAAVALATLGLLSDAGWEVPIEARRSGIATGRLPARLEKLREDPIVIIDGAHNDASAAALAEAMDFLCGETPRERRVLVIAISDDKDSSAVLKPLAGRFGHIVTTRFLDNPRASTPEKLAAVAQELTAREAVSSAATPADAYEGAKQRAGSEGAIVFAGSLLFAAEARRLVLGESKSG